MMESGDERGIPSANLLYSVRILAKMMLERGDSKRKPEEGRLASAAICTHGRQYA